MDADGRQTPVQAPQSAAHAVNDGPLTLRTWRTLAWIRQAQRLSQSDIARFVGVSRAAVSAWERGKVQAMQAHYAYRYAGILDEPVDVLFEAGPENGEAVV